MDKSEIAKNKYLERIKKAKNHKQIYDIKRNVSAVMALTNEDVEIITLAILEKEKKLRGGNQWKLCKQ